MDPYKILGVDKNASSKDIKSAYRKLALEKHPDKPGGNSEEFQKISEAYEILSDPSKKYQNDNKNSNSSFSPFSFGHGMPGMPGMARGMPPQGMPRGPMEQMFSSVFHFPTKTPVNESKKSPDIKHEVMLSLEDMYIGKISKLAISRSVECSECKGEGGSGKHEKSCVSCGGRGIRVIHNGSSVKTIKCLQCDNKGMRTAFESACKVCNSKGTVKNRFVAEAKFLPGSFDGSKVVLKEMSDFQKNKKKGDIIIIAKQKKHPFFKRTGKNLKCAMEISLGESLYGFEKTIMHLDNREVDICSKGVVMNKDILKISGEGIPKGSGYLEIELNIKNPGVLSENTRNKIREILD